MQKTKKFLAVMMAAMMIVAISATSALATEDPFAKSPDPIEITSVKNLGAGDLDFPKGDSIDNNVWTRAYADDLNVNLKWLWTTNDQQYAQKMNIAITSNELPDVMTVTATQLATMVENGQLMDITELLPKYAAPFTMENLNIDGGAGLKSATFDGKLYAVPQVSTGLMSTKVLWVRTDWLDKLSMKLPTTMDEFMAIADAFTNKDPDGNGKADTFGLAVNKDIVDGNYFAGLWGFFNAYGAYTNIWIPKDGGLVYGSIQPEMKTALAALQDMYKKGMIDPEFGVKDTNKVQDDVKAGKAGMMFGDFWNAAWINDMKVADANVEWMPIAIPSATGATAKAQLAFGTSQYYAINANCKNPEAVIRMLNLQLEKEYGATAEPTTYNITADGFGSYLYAVTNLEPPMKNFVAAQKVTEALASDDASKLNTEEKGYFDMCKASIAGDNKDNKWHQLKMFGPNGSLTVEQGYWDAGNFMRDEFYGAPTPAMTDKLSTLKKQQDTDFTAIITGASLDSFDTFVKTWGDLGGTQMTKEVNDWYAMQK